MVRFTRSAPVDESGLYDSIDQVVRIIDDPTVTRETVIADMKTGVYLGQWINEFGSIIYLWDAFDCNIAIWISPEQFNKIVQFLRQNPQRHNEIRIQLEQLRRRDIAIPDSPPGSQFRTPYMKLFLSDVYKNLP
jgi:hypothetical protein